MLAKKGLTQKEIANKMGVTQSNISATISRPSFPTLERIAVALDGRSGGLVRFVGFPRV